MTAAADIIRRSLRLIGVLATGETPAAAEQADALEALNAMLDTWRTESLSVYALRTETLPLTGAASYSIGVGGDLDIERPVKIESAYQRIAGVDSPVVVASKQAYDGATAKGTTGDPASWLYYEPSYPVGRVHLYPVPASGELHLTVWTPLAQLAASDDVALPPGYREAITYQLAMRLAAEYGKPVAPEIAAMGAAAKADIKRVNTRVPLMSSGLTTGQRYDVRTGF